MLNKQNLVELSQRQRELDRYIYENHKLGTVTHLVEKKLVAFLVELGEYANEERSFKYWSTRPQAPKNRQLDEYIDGLHFLLSLGNDFDYDFLTFNLTAPKANSIIDQYFEIVRYFNDLLALIKTKTQPLNPKTLYAELLNAYLGIATLAQYQQLELLTAYYQKNQINFQRQNQHY